MLQIPQERSLDSTIALALDGYKFKFNLVKLKFKLD